MKVKTPLPPTAPRVFGEKESSLRHESLVLEAEVVGTNPSSDTFRAEFSGQSICPETFREEFRPQHSPLPPRTTPQILREAEKRL